MWRKVVEGAAVLIRDEETVPPELQEVVESWTFDMPNPSPKSSNFNVTPHFSKLVDILQNCETQNPSFRGLVMSSCQLVLAASLRLDGSPCLAKKPTTALMITEMLQLLDDFLPELRPYTITHKDSGLSDEQVQPIFPKTCLMALIASQQAVLQAFKDGTYNLIITTKRAEALDLSYLTVIVEYVVIPIPW